MSIPHFTTKSQWFPCNKRCTFFRTDCQTVKMSRIYHHHHHVYNCLVPQFLIQFYLNIQKYNTHFCSNIQLMQLYSSGIASPIKGKNIIPHGKFLVLFQNFTKQYVPVSLLYTLYLHPANIDVRCEEKSPCQWI